jgi:hypothetical protein
MLREEALGFPAVATPVCGVNEQAHASIVADSGRRCTWDFWRVG